MRYYFIILIIFYSGNSFCQISNQIGQLKIIETKILNVDTVLEDVYGQVTKVVRLSGLAKSKVQKTCNIGHPSKNVYDTVENKVSILYTYDSTGKIFDSIFREIKSYVAEKELSAKQYNINYKFSDLYLEKSFFVNGDVIVPFIWTGAERSGDFQLFYLNKQVYKIILIEGNGLGSLSSFVGQNMYFTNDSFKIHLGKYIKNIEALNKILAAK